MSPQTFSYHKVAPGNSVEWKRKLIATLDRDLTTMSARWGIDSMTLPNFTEVQGEVHLQFEYTSAGWQAHLAGEG